MPPAARSASPATTIVAGLKTFPGLAHRQELIADHRRRALRQRQQGDQRRRRGQGARLLRHDLLDRRRPRQGRRPRRPRALLPRIAPRLPDRRGHRALRRGSSHGTRAPSAQCGTLDAAVAGRPRHGRARSASRAPSCCCRRPAPPSTSSPISRSAATRSAAPCRRCSRHRPRRLEARDDHLRPHRHQSCSAAGGGPSTAGRCWRCSPLMFMRRDPDAGRQPGGRRSASASTASTSCAST